MARNPGRVITRTDFNEIFSKAWYRGGTQANILSAFKATGIYPLDRYAVQIPGEERKKKSLPAATSTDIAFLPLYSPAPRPKACHSGTEKLQSTPSQDFLQFSPHVSPTPSPTEESCASGHTLSESPLQEVEHLSLASPPGESGDTIERPSQESFTDVELRKFAFSFENGYDVKDNHGYNMWLEIYHPELCDSPSSSRSSKEVTGPSEVLGRRQVFNKAILAWVKVQSSYSAVLV